MFSPKDAEQLTGIPGSTIRRYARQFSEFMSRHAQQRRRRFTQEDLDILVRIRDLAGEMRLDDVRVELARTIDAGPRRQETALTLPGVTAELEQLREMLEQAASKSDIAALEERIRELEEERKRPWWKRLFG